MMIGQSIYSINIQMNEFARQVSSQQYFEKMKNCRKFRNMTLGLEIFFQKIFCKLFMMAVMFCYIFPFVLVEGSNVEGDKNSFLNQKKSIEVQTHKKSEIIIKGDIMSYDIKKNQTIAQSEKAGHFATITWNTPDKFQRLSARKIIAFLKDQKIKSSPIVGQEPKKLEPSSSDASSQTFHQTIDSIKAEGEVRVVIRSKQVNIEPMQHSPHAQNTQEFKADSCYGKGDIIECSGHVTVSFGPHQATASHAVFDLEKQIFELKTLGANREESSRKPSVHIYPAVRS